MRESVPACRTGDMSIQGRCPSVPLQPSSSTEIISRRVAANSRLNVLVIDQASVHSLTSGQVVTDLTTAGMSSAVYGMNRSELTWVLHAKS